MRVVEGLPDDILRNVDSLSVDRRGEGRDAFMVTYEIIGHVAPETAYCVSGSGVSTADDTKAVSGSAKARSPSIVPPHLRISGDWDNSVAIETEQANILGDVGVLTIDTGEIVIPEAPTTPEMLGYYGGCLLSTGDTFRFDTHANLPVARMEIGPGYADGYLHLASKGGGAYLEHHDRPHLHLPLDEAAGGHLLLGRREGDDYLVSAFRIPFGSAIYTPPDVLHADPYLTGNYLVVYSVTENFSNAVLRTSDGGTVSVRISPEA